MGSQTRPVIRRARDADAETVARIHVASWQVAYRGIVPDEVIVRTDLAFRTAFWREQIADEDWPVFLLEEGAEAVAFCQMIPTKDSDDDPKRVGHITSLHVMPDLRGRGYGLALLLHVRGEFHRRGFRELTLWVVEQNWKARAFYEKHGLRADGGTRVYGRTNVPEVRYRTKL